MWSWLAKTACWVVPATVCMIAPFWQFGRRTGYLYSKDSAGHAVLCLASVHFERHLGDVLAPLDLARAMGRGTGHDVRIAGGTAVNNGQRHSHPDN